MRALTLDTATPDLVAGIVTDGQVAAETIVKDTKLLSEQLMPSIDALPGAYAELDVIIAGCGPGPFTGLRVGMATAQALGQALHIPVVGVCTHDAIAWKVAQTASGRALVATDARRKEIYFAFYELADGCARRVSEPDVVRPEELVLPRTWEAIDVINVPAHIAPRLPEWTREQSVHIVDDSPVPAGIFHAAEAAGLLEQLSESSAQPLEPLYLRRPDAKEPAAKPRSKAIPHVEI
ncbi:MAG: tRNA (adenosine(37)-N6)-threonylcarbamoyltransferase complex dimerization subunit type 1 TsaB [Corynebacterium sp.]|nr:tRNA (adenosine(37)-N6)-threonylcarbamoyltransferase complex dimerization subunit type 1 TsaB [Corynebacterium sp.]